MRAQGCGYIAVGVETGTFLELVTAAVCPPVRGHFPASIGAKILGPQSRSLAVSPVRFDTNGTIVENVGVSAGVVPDVDFFAFAGAVGALENIHDEGESSGPEGEECKRLCEIHFQELLTKKMWEWFGCVDAGFDTEY